MLQRKGSKRVPLNSLALGVQKSIETYWWKYDDMNPGTEV